MTSLTKSNALDFNANGPAAGGGGMGVPKIEITDEMIAAGEAVLCKALGGAVEGCWSPTDLAVSVYQAMRAVCRT
jgi:hypothetical protein